LKSAPYTEPAGRFAADHGNPIKKGIPAAFMFSAGNLVIYARRPDARKNGR
jgi:hypothetical protein